MEDLRWILLLVGGLVVVAVYFSSRFEREDWVREREEFDARNSLPKNASRKKPLNKKASSTNPEKRPSTIAKDSAPVVSQSSVLKAKEPKIRKEPQMPSKVVGTEDASDIELPTPPVMPPSEKGDVGVAESLEAPASSSASEIPTEVTLTEESVPAVFDAAAEERPQAVPEPKEEMPGLSIRAGIEDEITGVDIPADLAIAEAELQTTRHSENQQGDASESVSDQQALPENVEPLVLVLTVMAEDEAFTGTAVQEALEAEGLRHGEMRIFHCFDESLADDDGSDSNETSSTDDENALPVFSVASLIEPGYFELDKIDKMEIPGLTLFCQLPGPLVGPQSGEEAFNLMLDKGRGVAVRLHGLLCDDKRNVFTTQAKTHYLDRIVNFTRELSVARKKADA